MNDDLKNVYFIWGRGKTTIASRLCEKYGFYIYSTDDARDRLMETATPENQPNMCRDWIGDYGVQDFWQLPPEVIALREKHFLREMTPLIIKELTELSSQHHTIICEGDIDYFAVAPIAKNKIHLHSLSQAFDFFDRPDHCDMLDSVKLRSDISCEDKAKIIENAYKAVRTDDTSIPEWVTELGVKSIQWDDSTTIEKTLSDVEKYFGFDRECIEKAPKILLTSNGLETEFLEKVFLYLIKKEPENARVMFIPTAAVYPDAILVLPKCMNDLLKLGIKKENIQVYDMHSTLSAEDLKKFDALYFTGGDPAYLLNRINLSGFRIPLLEFINNGGVFLGVSAGSIIAANNLSESLGLVNCEIYVHCREGTKQKEILPGEKIFLTKENAVLLYGDKSCIIE
ncbi:MAG: hypothetical protein E7575_04580 [Ruminococcaceae bacterium]|nr:hypothetical protein [Oscillospiraceae bacterium]